LSNSFLRHRVTKNAMALFIVQAVSYVAPLLVLLYLTRVLGVEKYGVVAFSIGITQIGYVVLDLGFGFSATQKISVWRGRSAYLARLMGAIFCIKVAVFVVVAGAVTAYALTTAKYADHTALFLLSLLPMLGQCYQPIWFFSGIERMRYITVFTVIAKIVYVSLVFLLVSNEGDYLWVPVADGAAQIAAMVIGIGLIYRLGYRIAWPRWRDIQYTLAITRGVFVSRLAVAAYQTSGVFLLGLFSTPTVVAVYSLAEQFYRVMQQILVPVVLALYPYMAKEKNLTLLAKVAVGSTALSAAGAVAAYFAVPILLPAFFDASWSAVIPVFNVFALAITVNIMAVMSGYPLAAALGCLRVANSSVVYGALVYILLACALVLADQATPANFAWLMIIAEFYVLFHRGLALWPKAYRLQMSRNQLRGHPE
jgi:polysaccharide transporter, PST family